MSILEVLILAIIGLLIIKITVAQNPLIAEKTIEIKEPVNTTIPEIIKRIEQTPTPVQTTTATNKYSQYLNQKGDLRINYNEGECELAAKTFQKIYGGYIVFIAPYNTTDNSFIKCDFCGNWINLLNKGTDKIYVDYIAQRVFVNGEGMQDFYRNAMQSKHNNTNIDVKIYIYTIDTMPYPIIWHYP